MTTAKKQYAFMVVGATIGLIAAFWQTLEKLTLLKNKDAILSCDLGSVFSCSNVLNAPQSSVFGFPNSIMCMILFTIFLAVGLVGLTGGQIAKKMRLAVQGLSVFTLGFAFWFLFQSTYRIGAICIFCLFCFAGLLMVNGSWLRFNLPDLPLSKKLQTSVKKWVAKGADIFFWLLLALIVGAAIVFKFYA